MCLFVSFTAVAVVIYVNVQIAPALPPELLQAPTATPDIFSTPLASPTPIGGEVVEAEGTPRPRVTPDLVATATLPPDVLEALERQSPATPISNLDDEARTASQFIPEGGGCNPSINISEPRADSTVFGTIEFKGSANTEDFGAYLLELRGSGTGGDWIDILGSRVFDRIENDVLGAINLATLENGPYEARLTVFDLAGDASGRCTILFNINNE